MEKPEKGFNRKTLAGKNKLAKGTWEDPIVSQFLALKRGGTKARYRTGFDFFLEFLEKKGLEPSLKSLMRRIDEDRKLDRVERTHLEVSLLNEFVEYLQEVPLKKLDKEGKVKIGLAPKTINVYLSGILEFFRFHDLPIERKNLSIPKGVPRAKNEKMSIRREHIIKMLDHSTTTRDKSLILCLWSSGISIGDLLNLNVGSVQGRDNPPLMLHIVRKKTGIKYRTFLNRDSCKALDTYLKERERVFGKLSFGEPLFIKYKAHNTELNNIRLDIHSVAGIFKRLAKRSGVVEKGRYMEAELNPMRPHSLREGFSTVLSMEGCSSTLVHYLTGHKISHESAYFNMSDEELREKYLQYADVLSIERISPKEEEFRAMIKDEFGQSGLDKVEPKLRDLELVKRRISKVENGQTNAVYLLYYLSEKYLQLVQESNTTDKEFEEVVNTFVKSMGGKKLDEISLSDLDSLALKKLISPMLS